VRARARRARARAVELLLLGARDARFRQRDTRRRRLRARARGARPVGKRLGGAAPLASRREASAPEMPSTRPPTVPSSPIPAREGVKMPLCFIEPADPLRVIAESVGREARRQLVA